MAVTELILEVDFVVVVVVVILLKDEKNITENVVGSCSEPG